MIFLYLIISVEMHYMQKPNCIFAKMSNLKTQKFLRCIFTKWLKTYNMKNVMIFMQKLPECSIISRCSFKWLLHSWEILTKEMHTVQWSRHSSQDSIIHKKAFGYDLSKFYYDASILLLFNQDNNNNIIKENIVIKWEREKELWKNSFQI